MIKLMEWKCPECGRKIYSVHNNQFEYNKEQHIKSHERKNTSIEVGDKKGVDKNE